MTTINRETVRGKLRWVVDFGEHGGRRRRRYFGTEAAAKAGLRQAERDLRSGGDWWSALTDADRASRVAIMQEIDEAEADLATVWKVYQKLGSPTPTGARCTLKRAKNEVVNAKTKANRRPRYVDSLESYLNKFISGREKQGVHTIRAADIEAWFDDRKEAPTTRAANLGRLAAMFSHCVRRGYLTSNPCDRVEKVSIDTKAPVILTPKQTRVMLRFAAKKTPRSLGYFVLAVFAGIRPEELQVLPWSAVLTDRAQVRVEVAKTRRRRIVDLSPNALAWLKLCDQKGKVCPPVMTLRNHRRRIRDRLKLNWQQDLLRHTAASYMLGRDEDAARVAFQLGNSPGILLQHYRQLVTREEAEEFWSIVPEGRQSRH